MLESTLTASARFANPIGTQNIGWKWVSAILARDDQKAKLTQSCRFYIVYVVWLAIETTIIWFLYPETKGPTLEELGRLFEDENPLANGRLDLEKAHDDDAVHVEEKAK